MAVQKVELISDLQVDRAYKRLAVQLKRARDDNEKFAVSWSQEWKSLDHGQHQTLALKFGWRADYGRRLAYTGKHYPAKKQLILKRAREPVLPRALMTMYEICVISDRRLTRLARAGLFDIERPKAQIRKAGQTGEMPVAQKLLPRTPTAKIQLEFEKATALISKASAHVSLIKSLMEEHDITEVAGPKVRNFMENLSALNRQVKNATKEIARRLL